MLWPLPQQAVCPKAPDVVRSPALLADVEASKEPLELVVVHLMTTLKMFVRTLPFELCDEKWRLLALSAETHVIVTRQSVRFQWL